MTSKLLRILFVGMICICTSKFTLAAAESPIAPGAKLKKLAGDFAFTEGPTCDKKGNVFFTDQPNDRIMEWSVDGKLSTFLEPSGRANGLYFDAKGNLIACADEHNQLWSISRRKKTTVLVKDFQGKYLNGPNDVWVVPQQMPMEHWDGTTWEIPPSPPINGTLFDVWAHETSDVWACGTNGLLMHWDGSSWTKADVDTTETLEGVWGPASDDVWVVGSKGTILHFDGMTWASAFAPE